MTVGNAVTLGVAVGAVVSEGVTVAGGNVFVGAGVSVNGRVVCVRSSVGRKVKATAGVVVMVGVRVARLGTHNNSPTLIRSDVRQLTRFSVAVSVKYCVAIR